MTWCRNQYYDERYNIEAAHEDHMPALKLTQIGSSVGVILPKEALARLKLAKGDTVYFTENPDGVTLTPYQPRLDEQVEEGR